MDDRPGGGTKVAREAHGRRGGAEVSGVSESEADTAPIRIGPRGTEPAGARSTGSRSTGSRSAEPRGGARRPRRGWLMAGTAAAIAGVPALGTAACSSGSAEGGGPGGEPAVAPAASEFWVDP